MKRRRVKITGIGPVTPAGIGREAFWKGILEPVSRVNRLRHGPDQGGPYVAAEIRDFRFERILPGVIVKRAARHTQFALAGAALAVADAGLSVEELRGRKPVIAVGSAMLDFGQINKMIEFAAKKESVIGTSVPGYVGTMLSSSINTAIGDWIGGTTRAVSLTGACCAGIDSIGQCASIIAEGEADIGICGGTEAPLYVHPLIEMKLAGLVPGGSDNPERQGRPFDLWRLGGAMGEGACVVVLEPEESGRPGYGFVAGYGFASDSNGTLCNGFVDAAQLALANARMTPKDIHCLSAWGPGHPKIDAAEAAAMRAVFGEQLLNVPTVSIKGSIGNPFAAAGAIQVGCAAMGLREGVIPPTVNWEYPDPDCPLNLSRSRRAIVHDTVLINSHGVSGNNSCMVLTR
jgi:3-oxoacyl-(acyl-carrier-protein) synthase